MPKITFLGTGNGMPRQSSCTAIFVEDENQNALLDAGGGHDVIRQFYRANKPPADTQNIFISHYDTDHILGIVPLVRVIRRAETIEHTVYCSADVKSAIDSLFVLMAKNHYEKAKDKIKFVIVKDGDRIEKKGWQWEFFDVRSFKTPQLGCKITFPDGKILVYSGDAPLVEENYDVVRGCDVLIHEAFCLDRDTDKFDPHPKNHGTVKEAAETASKVKPGTLALIHMEDTTLDTRKVEYGKEAAGSFKGNIVVPVDGDVFEF